jgi:hypothetical protein
LQIKYKEKILKEVALTMQYMNKMEAIKRALPAGKYARRLAARSKYDVGMVTTLIIVNEKGVKTTLFN